MRKVGGGMDNYVDRGKKEIFDGDLKNEKSIDINISLSNDYYEAYITIVSGDEEISIDKNDILNALKESNVTFGIKNDVVDEIVLNPYNIYEVPIAKGERHVNGIDGRIEYYFDLKKKIKPKHLEDGKVDHKELNFIQQAKKGEVLAKKILPTESRDGQTVTNRTIRAKKGKLFNFKKGKNVVESEDGISLIANANGEIKAEDGKISVIKVLEINQNVGVATGNIRFEGKVLVKGNVESGYIIRSGEDVEVEGIVEGAEIIAKNIIIHKGIHNNAKLVSEGNIISNFMENCHAEAEGDIICDALIHCHIKCMGKIIAAKKKGLILGGDIYVREEVIAKTIGSQIGSITKIKLGIDENLLIDIKNTKTSIEEKKISLGKVNQAIEVLQIKKNQDSKKKIFLNKYLKTREQCTKELKMLDQHIKTLYSVIEALRHSKVSSEEIHPGTNIRINNSHYIVKNILSNVTLLKENGEIVIAPNLRRS